MTLKICFVLWRQLQLPFPLLFSEGKNWFCTKIIECPATVLIVSTRSLEISLKFVQLHVVLYLPLSKMIMKQRIYLFIFKLKLSSHTFYSRAFIDIYTSFFSSIKKLHNDESYRLPSRYPWHVLTCLQNQRCRAFVNLLEGLQNRWYRRY